jgi:predicted ATPase/DNA-binding SARP family transcriptional activator
VRFKILGPVAAEADGGPVRLGGPRQRALVALLLVHANEVVSRDSIIDSLWPDKPPAAAARSLEVAVSTLRRALGASSPIETRPPGYRLALQPDALDARCFERLADEGRAALEAGDAARATSLFDDALALWQGPALADVAGEPFARTEALRLDELRGDVRENRLAAALELGETPVAELEALVREEPLRERPRSLLMLALYRAGRQADALELYRETRSLFVEELGIEPSPSLQRLERAILAHERSLEPRASTRPSLPRPASTLLGRTRELNELCELVRAARIVTLTGAGGIGKTRLALEVAHRLEHEFADGAAFVDLTAVSEPELLAEFVAGALDETPASLSTRELLLVLDNFEHLLAAAPALASLVASAPGVTALVTSRAALRLGGEVEFVVPPLEGGAELFEERARAVRREFVVDEERRRTIDEICRRLDGLPLAIELAAARARVLEPEQILERLSQRFELLTGGARDAPARQQTLRTTIDWSFRLLEPSEQELFVQLAVFVGGWTLDAAEAVVGTADVLDGLSSLVEKNLVRRVGDGRFAMLETLREYALERLAGDAPAVRRRHAEWYADFAERVEPELKGRRQAEFFRRLNDEHANLVAAAEFAAAEGDAELSLRIAGSVRLHWLVHGRFAEGERLLRAGLAAGDASPLVRVNGLLGIGMIAGERGDIAAAQSAFEEAHRLAHASGHPLREVAALTNLATLAFHRGDLPESERLYRESAELTDALGYEHGYLVAMENLATLRLAAGRPHEALAFLDAAMPRARAANDSQRLTSMLRGFARAGVLDGRADDAVAASAESLRIARELGDQPDIAGALETEAGLALLVRDDAEQAARLLGAADRLRADFGGARSPEHEAWLGFLTPELERRLGERLAELKAEGGRAPLDSLV